MPKGSADAWTMNGSLRSVVDWISPSPHPGGRRSPQLPRSQSNPVVGRVDQATYFCTTSAFSATAAGTREPRAKLQMVWQIATEEA
jgi:hypothetical protein